MERPPKKTAKRPKRESRNEHGLTVASPQLKVTELLVQGYSPGEIEQFLKREFPGHDPEELIEESQDELAVASEADPNVVFGWCLMARRYLYRKMLEAEDYEGALKATDRIEQLVTKLN